MAKRPAKNASSPLSGELGGILDDDEPAGLEHAVGLGEHAPTGGTGQLVKEVDAGDDAEIAVAEGQLLGVLGDERHVGEVRQRVACLLQVVRAEIEGRETEAGVGDGDLRQRPPGPAGDVEEAGAVREPCGERA